jgi:hypothetical protein
MKHVRFRQNLIGRREASKSCTPEYRSLSIEMDRETRRNAVLIGWMSLLQKQLCENPQAVCLRVCLIDAKP